MSRVCKCKSFGKLWIELLKYEVFYKCSSFPARVFTKCELPRRQPRPMAGHFKQMCKGPYSFLGSILNYSPVANQKFKTEILNWLRMQYFDANCKCFYNKFKIGNPLLIAMQHPDSMQILMLIQPLPNLVQLTQTTLLDFRRWLANACIRVSQTLE